MKEPNKNRKNKNRAFIDRKTGVVHFNKKLVCSKDIVLPSCVIKSGEPFFLKDAYIEEGIIFIGVRLESRESDTFVKQWIEEAGFSNINGEGCNLSQIIPFINNITFPYLGNGNEYFFL
tara:strand:- start:552 stop:908 length:357 start_codon:yes stop_codon:yes gene_type:complete